MERWYCWGGEASGSRPRDSCGEPTESESVQLLALTWEVSLMGGCWEVAHLDGR
jgi:hypothetical protein